MMRVVFVSDAHNYSSTDQLLGGVAAEHGPARKTDSVQKHPNSVTNQPRTNPQHRRAFRL
jgi:hypothetical protein